MFEKTIIRTNLYINIYTPKKTRGKRTGDCEKV